MLSEKYDVIIIGSGPGGMSAAYGLASSKKVLVVEKDSFGGTCPNRGCDPKKILYTAVNHYLIGENLKGSGLAGENKINWSELMAFKRSYTDQIDVSMEKGLNNAGVDTIKGEAHFLDAKHIDVAGKVIAGDTFILAAGAKADLLDIPGKEYLSTSREVLALEKFPKRIGFIGSGYVGMELINIATAMDSEVHVFQRNHQLLPQFPVELTTKIGEVFAERGVHFHWNTQVTAVEKRNDTLTAMTDLGEQVNVDLLVSAIGRPADVSGLGLENTKVEVDHHGIVVNSYLQTAEKNIYALGDVVSKRESKLTPVSHFEGNYLVGLLSGDKKEIEYPVIPSIAFTTPQIAQTGVSVKEAQVHPERYHVEEIDLHTWFNYLIHKDHTAKAIVITDKNSGLLKGAAMLSFEAEEIINLMTWFINNGSTSEDVKQQIFLYPTLASDLSYLY